MEAMWNQRYKGKITMVDEMHETFFVLPAPGI
jgi:hypothetical protein